MQLKVHESSNVPIYEQIFTQIIFMIAVGDVDAGDFIPSVRELSQQLLVNPNTVARAYQDLERLGIVESRRGTGMLVTVAGPKLCREQRKLIVVERVREALRDAAAAGLSVDDLHKMINDNWTRVNGAPKATRSSTDS